MKRSLKALLCAVFSLVVLICFCSCKNEPVTESSYLHEISYLSRDEQRDNAIKDVLAQYFTAVSRQDHINVERVTTEDFIWHYNETEFEDYARYIESFSLDETDTEHITENNGEYSIPVTYTLSYREPFTNENGDEQPPGEYTYDVTVTLKNTDDGWLISQISDRALG